jgi:hypothetical protein
LVGAAGFEPTTTSPPGLAILSAGVRGVLDCARTGHLDGRNDRGRPPLLVPRWYRRRPVDIFEKAGNKVGDVVGKARERERVRLEDRLRQLDRIEENARTYVFEGRTRAGYGWTMDMEGARLVMVAAATTIGDDDLSAAVDALGAVRVPFGGEPRDDELDACFRAVVGRLAVVRRETLADD